MGAPKALRQLCGEPLHVHAVRRVAAARSVAAVVVAAPPGESSQVRDLVKPVVGDVLLIVVDGGATRQESVALALAAVPGDLPIVLVHDAARPLTPSGLVDEVAAAVRAGHPAVVPVLPVADTIRRADGSGVVDRSTLLAVQTPQGFARSVLADAHRAAASAAASGGPEATDDAGLAERIGVAVHSVPGRDEALKVTRPFDLLVAEAMLASGAAG